MSEAIIELKNIRKHYGKHEVLKGVDMQINRGDIYGLIGRNGAGKTTIFKMILGLSEITEGTVSIAGSSTRSELYKTRGKIGFLVGSRFFNYLSARENLKYYATIKGIPHRQMKSEIDRVLEIECQKTVQDLFSRHGAAPRHRRRHSRQPRDPDPGRADQRP